MSDDALQRALERSEFALRRIERSLNDRPAVPAASAADEELRAKVREAVAELDQIIREVAE